MKNDIDAVKAAITIFPSRYVKLEQSEHLVYDLPDTIQVATVAAILATTNQPDDENIRAAIKLIADTQRILKELRSDATSPEMPIRDLRSMTMIEAVEDTGLTRKTILRHARELGQPVTGDKIHRSLVTEIKDRSKKAKLDRAKAGFNASGFKGKKRKLKKS